MNAVQRKIRSKAAVAPTDAFMVAVHLKYASLTAFAAKLGVTVQFLSQIRSGKKHMPDELGARIELLTGYPAAKWR